MPKCLFLLRKGVITVIKSGIRIPKDRKNGFIFVHCQNAITNVPPKNKTCHASASRNRLSAGRCGRALHPSTFVRTPAPRGAAGPDRTLAQLPRRAVPQPGAHPADHRGPGTCADHAGIPVPFDGEPASGGARGCRQDRFAGARPHAGAAGLVRTLLLPDLFGRAADSRGPGFPERRSAGVSEQGLSGQRPLPPGGYACDRPARHHPRPLGPSRLPYGPRTERPHRKGRLSAGCRRTFRTLGIRSGADRRTGLGRGRQPRGLLPNIAPLLGPGAESQ